MAAPNTSIIRLDNAALAGTIVVEHPLWTQALAAFSSTSAALHAVAGGLDRVEVLFEAGFHAGIQTWFRMRGPDERERFAEAVADDRFAAAAFRVQLAARRFPTSFAHHLQEADPLTIALHRPLIASAPGGALYFFPLSFVLLEAETLTPDVNIPDLSLKPWRLFAGLPSAHARLSMEDDFAAAFPKIAEFLAER